MCLRCRKAFAYDENTKDPRCPLCGNNDQLMDGREFMGKAIGILEEESRKKKMIALVIVGILVLIGIAIAVFS